MSVPVNPVGIQIAGPSSDVFVIENEIDSAGRNGITLGSFEILDTKGNSTGLTGVTITVPGPATQQSRFRFPALRRSGRRKDRLRRQPAQHSDQSQPYPQQRTVRHRPGGFFNLVQELEIITIEKLTITANTHLAFPAAPAGDAQERCFALRLWCDLRSGRRLTLAICDNSITDFGRAAWR